MLNSNTNILIEKLDQFIRKYYKNILIKGALLSLTFLLFTFLLIVITEYYGNFSVTIRSILFYSYISVFAYVLVKYIFIPTLKIYKLGKIISYEQASEIIGNHFPQVQDKLLNVLQLQKSTSVYSQNLVEAAVDHKIKELKPFNFKHAVNLKENIRYLRVFVIPIIIILIMSFVSPFIIKKGTQRLMKYSTDFPKEFPYQFVFLNNNLKCYEGDNFELNIAIEGEKKPGAVYIVYNNREYKLNSLKNKAKYSFLNMQNDVSFQLTDGKDIIKIGTIQVFPRPKIIDFTLFLDYPKYIGKKDEEQKNTADIIIPEGTKVKWTYKSKNTDEIKLIFISDSTIITLDRQKDQYEKTYTPTESGVYYSILYNSISKKVDTITNSIKIIKDEFPTIISEEFKDSLRKNIFYFNGTIRDDYGFSSLYFKTIARNEDNEIVSQKAELIQINARLTAQNFYHIMDGKDWQNQSGHTIEYYFEVFDNDGVNGKKSSKSKIGFFKVPSIQDIQEEKEALNSTIKKDLTESIKEAKQVQKELENLWKDLANKRNVSWEEKKKMENLLQRQKDLQKQLEKDLQKNEQLIEESENAEEKQAMVEKQKQIQEMFENLVSDEMKKMMEELQQLMEELNKNNAEEKVEDIKMKNEDIQKELDRTLELFKQLEFEQKLEENLSKLEELSKEQKELNKETENTKPEDEQKQQELQKKQDELNTKFEELKKEMDKMNALNEELEFKNDMPNTDQKEEEISKEMNDAKNSMNNKNNKSASQSQKKAAQKMDEMKDQLEQAQGAMQQEAQEENLEDMKQLMENLVKFSFAQEELMKEMRKTSVNDPKYTKQIQAQNKLKDDAKLIEDSLFALSKRVAEIQPVINKELNAMNENLEKTIDVLAKRQTFEANNRQQQVMTTANNLALLFDEMVQQMQQQMAQQKFGNASCNKPGSNGKPKPSDARKMQQQLSKQLEQLKNELGKQKDGQKKGGEGGKMSKDLAKMAAEQEAIRRQVQEMMEEMNSNGQKSGGDLKKIAEMMEETERDIVNKRITEQTINRQKDILTRLLESEKAERERDQDDDRESNESKTDEKRNLLEEFKYKAKKTGGVDVLESVPPTMNDFYKQKVNGYFNKLAE